MLRQKTALLSTTYFGPVQYFTKLLLHSGCLIEIHDHYTKQTYRNRCNIYGANGMLTLSVPVLREPGYRTRVREVRPDYSKNWRKLHWKGIESAYMHSPFFEFYRDGIRHFFNREYRFLLDLNTEILNSLLGFLEMDPQCGYTDEFMDQPGEHYMDYRELIHPKTEISSDLHFQPRFYRQVFGNKHGFIPNLSILDLLFNAGPDAGTILRQSLPSGLISM